MPKSISDYVGVDPKVWAKTGAFDAILDVDSLLFIDPHLLSASSSAEARQGYMTLIARFRQIIKMLSASKTEEDAFWRQADRLFTFPEFQGLCIGYSGKSTSGSGMGPGLRRQVLRTAKAIVDEGIIDPELFELIGVFEEGVGPDRISDMVGRVIAGDLRAFTTRVLAAVGAKTVSIEHDGHSYQTVMNPFNHSAVILIPRDILRDLPVAQCWDDIDRVCAHNQQVRKRVNGIIGDTWRQATREKKEKLKQVLLSEPEAVKDLIKLYKNKPALIYDFENDPAGEVAWYKAAKDSVAASPLALFLPANPSPDEVLSVVVKICEQFKSLIENNALSGLLYDSDGKPKHESAAQKLFYGIAEAYCEANNVDLSREPNAGRGPVDFKISKGYNSRVLVEAKLTSNKQLLHGFETQIGEYQFAEKTRTSVYLVVEVDRGSPGAVKRLRDLITVRSKKGDRIPMVIFVDGRRKASASKYRKK